MTKDTKRTPGENKPAATKKSAAPKKAAEKKSSTAKASKNPAAEKKKAPAKTSQRGAKNASSKAIVQVKADIGFGNHLFIRGDGPGLNWDSGVPMACKDADMWEWSASNGRKAISFKVLINDEVWAQGENLELKPGEMKTVVPEF